MKTAAVVVTYNRLSLLKECLDAIVRQTVPPDAVFVIDNCSTDGTADYLATLGEPFVIISLEKNIGGAGGFSRGIKEAVTAGFDYVWVMDDDTVPEPDALTNLLKAFTVADNVGFAVSKAIWNDGQIHKMNIPTLAAVKDRSICFNSYSRPDMPVFLVKNASFVSMLVSAEAVLKAGLPIADFFIWADDFEFSLRVIKAGFLGLYVDNSIVVHKTPDNYFAQPQYTAPENAWKFYYQARNTYYMQRKYGVFGSLVSFAKAVNHYRLYLRRVNKRNDHKGKIFMRYIRKGLIDGMKFNPEIEYINPNQISKNTSE